MTNANETLGLHLAVLGTGAALPETRVGPADFVAAGADPAVLAEWDVGEHRVASTESATDLEARAALQAIARAGWTPDDVDLMIGCTLLPEKVNPSNVSLTQHKIGASRAAAIGLDMACIGPVPALMMADALFRTGQFARILVVASSQLRGAMDDTDPAVFAVCGDGAAAVALGPVDGEAGVIATQLTARGQYWSNVGIEPRPPRHPRAGGACDVRPRFYIDHSRGGDVKEFFTWCMGSVPAAVDELLRKQEPDRQRRRLDLSPPERQDHLRGLAGSHRRAAGPCHRDAQGVRQRRPRQRPAQPGPRRDARSFSSTETRSCSSARAPACPSAPCCCGGTAARTRVCRRPRPASLKARAGTPVDRPSRPA